MAYRNVEAVKTADIRPYQTNAKIHDDRQVQNIATSITKYGFTQPIVIDKDNVVVIGHGRLLAAIELGLETVPCIKIDDVSEEEANQLRIIDNRLNESPWDVEILEAELETVDLEDFDLDLYEASGEKRQREPADLNDPFLIFPTSALRGDGGAWLKRKAAWIQLGIRSEKGR